MELDNSVGYWLISPQENAENSMDLSAEEPCLIAGILVHAYTGEFFTYMNWDLYKCLCKTYRPNIHDLLGRIDYVMRVYALCDQFLMTFGKETIATNLLRELRNITFSCWNPSLNGGRSEVVTSMIAKVASKVYSSSTKAD